MFGSGFGSGLPTDFHRPEFVFLNVMIETHGEERGCQLLSNVVPAEWSDQNRWFLIRAAESDLDLRADEPVRGRIISWNVLALLAEEVQPCAPVAFFFRERTPTTRSDREFRLGRSGEKPCERNETPVSPIIGYSNKSTPGKLQGMEAVTPSAASTSAPPRQDWVG